jgi:hypothetical protein
LTLPVKSECLLTISLSRCLLGYFHRFLLATAMIPEIYTDMEVKWLLPGCTSKHDIRIFHGSTPPGTSHFALYRQNLWLRWWSKVAWGWFPQSPWSDLIIYESMRVAVFIRPRRSSLPRNPKSRENAGREPKNALKGRSRLQNTCCFNQHWEWIILSNPTGVYQIHILLMALPLFMV